ncbi:TPA: hypothetical protein ACILOQ_003663, partial [Escherichia coli]
SHISITSLRSSALSIGSAMLRSSYRDRGYCRVLWVVVIDVAIVSLTEIDDGDSTASHLLII